MQASKLLQLVLSTLDDMKAMEVTAFNVQKITNVTDFMVICTGNSNRHVRAIANNLVVKAKENGVRPLGVEGEQDAEWILVDLADVVIHIMQAKTREFYQLDKLWDTGSNQIT